MDVFRHEVNARRYVQKAFWVGIASAVGLFFFAWHMHTDTTSKWDIALFSTIGTLVLGLWLFGLGPLMWKVPAGTYFRVTLTEQHLQVESPHAHFGKSADIRLDDIVELRTVMSGTDELRHEIYSKGGDLFTLNHNGGLRPDLLFERILDLRPNLLHRRGQAKEFTAKA